MAIVDQRDLMRTLHVVRGFTLPRHETYRHVRVWTGAGKLNLTASTGQHSARATVGTNTNSSALDVLVDATELRAALGAHKGELELSGSGDTLTIARVREPRRGTIRGVPPTDWVEPSFDGELVGMVLAEDLRGGIARVAVAASKDSLRPVFHHISLAVTGDRNRLMLVGSDACRLAKDEIPLNYSGTGDATPRS